MDGKSQIPRLVFVMNLSGAEATEISLARVRHLIHLFHGHRLPATWLVAGTKCAALLTAQRTSSSINTELALAITDEWGGTHKAPSQFQKELIRRCAEVGHAANQTVGLVAGKLQTLRTRVALLAQIGVSGILTSSENHPNKRCRPLPCGLWQLDLAVHIPHVRRFARWLPGKRLSAKQLLVPHTLSGPTFISVDSAALGKSNARSLRAFEKLLCDIAWAESRGQVAVTTSGQVVEELGRQRIIKPQRSILTHAA